MPPVEQAACGCWKPLGSTNSSQLKTWSGRTSEQEICTKQNPTCALQTAWCFVRYHNWTIVGANHSELQIHPSEAEQMPSWKYDSRILFCGTQKYPKYPKICLQAHESENPPVAASIRSKTQSWPRCHLQRWFPCGLCAEHCECTSGVLPAAGQHSSTPLTTWVPFFDLFLKSNYPLLRWYPPMPSGWIGLGLSHLRSFIWRRINHCFVGTHVTAIELEWNRLICN